jgi:hypothetical protein
MRLRKWLEGHPIPFLASLVGVFVLVAGLLFVVGWWVAGRQLQTLVEAHPHPISEANAVPSRSSKALRDLGMVDLSPMPELVVRACRPKSHQPCTSAPLAFLELPVSDRWGEAANRLFQKMVAGRHGAVACRTIDSPAVEIDCGFGDDDPRAVLLTAGLATLDEVGCASAGRKAVCDGLAADQRFAASHGRGMWSSDLWARGGGDAVAILFSGAATIFGTAIVVSGGLCAAIWYSVHGGEEGLAKRLRDKEADDVLLQQIAEAIDAAGSSDDIRNSFGVSGDAAQLVRDGKTTNKKLELVDQIGNLEIRADISKVVWLMITGRPFADRKLDAQRALDQYQKSRR